MPGILIKTINRVDVGEVFIACLSLVTDDNDLLTSGPRLPVKEGNNVSIVHNLFYITLQHNK